MHFTDVLNLAQLEFLAKHLPQPRAYTGRPAYTNLDLLPGILRVLRSGCRWRDLDLPGSPSGVTHWRRLRHWRAKCGLWPVWRLILRLLTKASILDLSTSKLDGSLVPSFAFNSATGYSGRHKRTGTKISTLVDGFGIPLSVTIAPGNVHDLPMAMPTLDQFQIGRRKRPKVILADKGYDSKRFRTELRKRRIKANIPQRVYTKRKRKRGRPPKYDKDLGKTRFVVERTNAWLKSFRRLHFRFDRNIGSFESLVIFACIVVCVRRLIP